MPTVIPVFATERVWIQFSVPDESFEYEEAAAMGVLGADAEYV